VPARQRHVVPNPDGGWDVRAPGNARSSSHHESQSDAIVRAREILRRTGGGQAVIHGRDGTVRNSDTVSPRRDPFPPRARH
jgi:Uncharacterized protein conserved in bacteria (DUF2188)